MKASVSNAFAAASILAMAGRMACSAGGEGGTAQALPADRPTQIIATTASIFFMRSSSQGLLKTAP
jgi:hypothetical protein